MDRPDFRTLPDIGSGYRAVGGVPMDEEQYRIEGWHRAGPKGQDSFYVVPHPHRPGCLQPSRRIEYWQPTLEGLRAYSRLLTERWEARIAAKKAREEHEDSFREYVNALDDAKPGGHG